MSRPQIINHPLYVLLRYEKVAEFNAKRAAGEYVDLSHCDFRGLDLRGLQAAGLNMKGGYFRGTDLRGIDFSQTDLEGASICQAKISGVLFPSQIDPQEIFLSHELGTRMR